MEMIRPKVQAEMEEALLYVSLPLKRKPTDV
jgi:hypothetical protein